MQCRHATLLNTTAHRAITHRDHHYTTLHHNNTTMSLLWRGHEGARQGTHTPNVIIHSMAAIPHNFALQRNEGIHQEPILCAMVRATPPWCERHSGISRCCGHPILQPQAIMAQGICRSRHHASPRDHCTSRHKSNDAWSTTPGAWSIHKVRSGDMRNTTRTSARCNNTHTTHNKTSQPRLALHKLTQHLHADIAEVVDYNIRLSVAQKLMVEGCGKSYHLDARTLCRLNASLSILKHHALTRL